jgi:4-amino-4-deoxy-L-arabinose transferase-like glycosyltransferase
MHSSIARVWQAIRAHPDLAAVLIIIALGAALRVAFFSRAPIFIHGDSSQYFVPARELLLGQGLNIPLKRPPVYPLFLAAATAWVGEDLLYVAFFQHILGLGTAVMVYGVGRFTIGRAAGVFGGLMAALSGNLLIYEHYILTESVFTFFLAAGVFFFVAGMKRDSLRLYMLSGLGVGLATLTRPHAQLILLIGPFVVAFATRHWKAVLRATLGTGIVAGLVMLPWMLRNYAVYKEFTVAGALGQNMVMQTLAFHNGSFQFYDPENPPDDPDPKRAWARKYIQDRDDDKMEKPWLEITGIGIHGRIMHEMKVSEGVADRYMRDVALEAIRARPLTWLRLAFDDFRMIVMGVPDELAFHWKLRESRKWPKEYEYLIQPPTPAQESGFWLTDKLVNIYQGPRLGPIVPFLFIIGLVASVFTPTWRRSLLPGLTVLALCGVSAATVAFVTRYHHPPDPLMHVVAFGGITVVVQQVRALIERLRGARLSQPASVGRGVS